MFLQRYRFRWSLIAAIVAVLGAVLFYETRFIRIETDILASLPKHDAVLADAHRVIRHLPFQDRLVLDVAITGGDREALVAAADRVEEGLRLSGLFRDVGTRRMEALFPELIDHAAAHLPLLFDGPDLEAEIAPRLTPAAVRRALEENLRTVQGLEGIGQAGFIGRDPLGLRNLVLARMSQIMPAREVQLHRGKLLSRDGRHLLIIAELAGSATDSAYAGKIPPLIADLGARLDAEGLSRGQRFTLTPVGAYRAALDNENAARHDMGMAVALTTLGIALLLVITFPRPLVGLLALLPSTAGAILALLVCSWLFPSLSLLAVSFGGAILAFTVDMGITYLLFLDRPCAVGGREAAREVRTAEALAALTTITAFLLLLLSSFSVLAQVGLFAALGVAFTFAFVHWVFPLIFPVMPPALTIRGRWLGRLLDRIALGGGRARAAVLALFFLAMLLLARPVFLVDISAMNSLSPESIAAEKTIQQVWGDLTSRLYVMTEGRSLAELQARADDLAGELKADRARGVVKEAFLLADLFPGEALAGRRTAAWRAFWTAERTAALQRELERSGTELGFARGAFAPFLALIAAPPAAVPVPERFAGLLGITAEGQGYVQVAMVTPGPAYAAEAFFARYAAAGRTALFDAGLFNRRLGAILVDLFTEIALLVGAGIVLGVLLFFADWRRALIVLCPVTFALVCTLGSLKLLGRPIDIPGIMLWVVIMGMGIDYGIYYVGTYQRYLDERHPALTLIRQAMFLSAATTLIGFGVLALADHAVLKSIGLTSLLGVGYSLIGALLIVPPLIRRVLVPAVLPPEPLTAGSRRHNERLRLRYRHLAATPRLFARWKVRLDPMFPRLADLVGTPRRILDVGCGYGVPSVWLLELFPVATVCGIDPDPERVRIAGQALGSRGETRVSRAPEIEALPGGADTALILDVIHMLDDAALARTLAVLREKLLPGGRLVLRAVMPGDHQSWLRFWEELRMRRQGVAWYYRSRESVAGFITAAGFALQSVEDSVPTGEVVWFIAAAPPAGGPP